MKYCIKIKLKLVFRKVEDTISEKNRLDSMLSKTTEALKVYFEELKRIKKALLSAMTPLNATQNASQPNIDNN